MCFQRVIRSVFLIFLLVLLVVRPGCIIAQVYYMAGFTAGVGESKLAPHPGPSFKDFERFPAYAVGLTSEIINKDYPLSIRAEFWYESGGDEGEGLQQLTLPIAIKAAFGDTWGPFAFAGLGLSYIMEKNISYKDFNVSALYGAGIEWKFKPRRRAYIQYSHQSGITSVFDEWLTPIGSTQILVQNHHTRHYVSLGILFNIGYPNYYIKH